MFTGQAEIQFNRGAFLSYNPQTPGRLAQSVHVWLQMPVWLQIQGSRGQSQPGTILSWGGGGGGVDHEIIITVFFNRPSADSFKKGFVVSYKRKYVHKLGQSFLIFRFSDPTDPNFRKLKKK